ncbi:MAG: hypothetical protein ACLP2P_12795 [Desulfobaccales bacterium]
MLKRLLERFRQDRGLHKATVRVDFSPQNQVTPQISWLSSDSPEADTVPLVLLVYARILYELAELNEGRVARELIRFLDQVCARVLDGDGPPRRPRLPLGQLTMGADPGQPATRSYQAEFYEFEVGGYRLDFQGSLGKEGYYLPGAFLALLQSCLDHLGDDALRRLTRGLVRLHLYYRYRRDFWEGGALTGGPVFALGTEEIHPEAVTPEV